VNLAELRAWSEEGRRAAAEAPRRLAADGRSLELAAIPSRGVLLSDEDCPDIPVHPDLPTALAAHAACQPAMAARDSAPPADLPDR
jgi:hypothetical protein